MRKLTYPLVLALSLLVPLNASLDAVEGQVDEVTRQKAADLIAGMVEDVKALTLPENRIWALMRAADLLWRVDEKQARTLIAEAVKAFEEMLGGLEETEDYEQTLNRIFELRREMLLAISRHDARLAQELLRATRQPMVSQPDRQYRRTDFEAEIETGLAIQMVATNPKQAAILAGETLQRGFSSELPNLLYLLEQHDPGAAAELAGAIVKQLEPEDIEKDYAARAIAFNMISRVIEAGRPMPPGQDVRKPLLDEKTLRALKETVFDGGLRAMSTAPIYNWPMQGQMELVMQEFDAFVARRSPAMRAKLTEYNEANRAKGQDWNKYNEIVQNASIEAALEAASQAPFEMRNHIYQQAAWKAFNAGDTARAYAIIDEKITDPGQRKSMKAGFHEQLVWRAVEQEKLSEAKRLISEIPSTERRISLLVQLSQRALEATNKKLALELLGEARGFISSRPANHAELESRFELAGAYAALEANPGFELLEPAIARINENMAAATVLDGFDIYGYFINGEFTLRRGTSLLSTVQRCSEVLGSLARQDLDRARSAVDLLQRSEARILARLGIAEAVLSNRENPGMSSGIGISHGRGMRMMMVRLRPL